MFTIQNLLALLEEIAPQTLSEQWDNCGLLIGDPNACINHINIALEADEDVIARLPEDSALIVHHPLIFTGLKRIQYDQYPGKYIQQCIKKNIHLIAMHTNADAAFLGEYVAREILHWPIIQQNGYLLDLEVNLGFEDCQKHLQEKLHLPICKAVKAHDFITSVTLITGSGASFLASLQTDALLTGDIKYHDAVHAQALRKSMFDIGHFESEHWFSQALASLLAIRIQEQTPNIHINATKSNNPFVYLNSGILETKHPIT